MCDNTTSVTKNIDALGAFKSLRPIVERVFSFGPNFEPTLCKKIMLCGKFSFV